MTDKDTPPGFTSRFPTAIALGLSVLLTLGIARGRPAPRSLQENTGENPARFWAEKARVTARLDVALAGDSRVFRGLAPEEMRSVLPKARIGNLGFSGACLCGDYLAYVEAALAADGGPKTIVLGVTPHSLTMHAAHENGFLAERGKSTRERLEDAYLGPVEDALRPLEAREVGLHDGSREKVAARYVQDHREDGWVASQLLPENPNGALVEYDRVLRTAQVDPAIESELIAAVTKWRARDIRVIAFRPPTTSEMRDLERTVGHYDEAAFIARFREAGGEYWEIQPDSYHTYDGSHLTADSARALSRDVAARLLAR